MKERLGVGRAMRDDAERCDHFLYQQQFNKILTLVVVLIANATYWVFWVSMEGNYIILPNW